MDMLIQMHQRNLRTIQQGFLYMDLYSNFLYVRPLTWCYSPFLLVSFTLKGGERFESQVSKSEIGDLIARSASAVSLRGTNSCKKKCLV